MKILALHPTYPWPRRSGADHRASHLLLRLARRARVFAAFLEGPSGTAGPSGPSDPLAGALENVARLPFSRAPWPGLLQSLRDPLPVTIRHWDHPGAHGALRRLVRSRGPFDLVLCQDLPLFPYALTAMEEEGAAPLVIDRTRVDASFQAEEAPLRLAGTPRRRRWGHRVHLAKLVRFERRVARATSLQVVCASSDARFLHRRIDPALDVLVVPNGVATRCLPPLPARKAEPGTLVFTGCLDYFPNEDGLRWFLAGCWRRIRSGRPGARLVVAGRRPNAAFLHVLSEAGAEILVDAPDVHAVIGRAELVIAPVRIGGGTRLKIVEGWAAGRPVVATSRAADGLEATHGEHLLLADDPEGFARAVLRLLDDAALRERIAARGRALAERAYDWDVLFERWWRGLAGTLRCRPVPAAAAPVRPPVPASWP